MITTLWIALVLMSCLAGVIYLYWRDADSYANRLDDLILYLDSEVIPGTHTLTTDAVCALQDQANEIREFADEQKENGE